MGGDLSLAGKFLRLPGHRKRLLCTCLVLLTGCRLLLALVSIKTIRLLIDRSRPARQPVAAEDIAWSVQTASRHLPWTACLTNALTGHYLLRRYGYPSRLHIGVRKEEDHSLAAHAWVTLDNRIIIGKLHDLENYTILPDKGMTSR